nr:MAG TPA: hypothetical protein [Caudoviricetes sp.]
MLLSVSFLSHTLEVSLIFIGMSLHTQIGVHFYSLKFIWRVSNTLEGLIFCGR